MVVVVVRSKRLRYLFEKDVCLSKRWSKLAADLGGAGLMWFGSDVAHCRLADDATAKLKAIIGVAITRLRFKKCWRC